MSEEQIKKILYKYINNSLTLKERLQLTDWIKDEANKQHLLEFIDEQWGMVINGTAGNADKLAEEKYEAVFKAIIFDMPEITGSRKDGRIRSIVKWLSAAAVMVALAVGSYYFVYKNQPLRVQADASATIDVPPPAGNKATITLADGTVLYLDSLKSGQAMQQGNITMVKLADGKLAYQTAEGKIMQEILYNSLTNPAGSNVIDLTLADGTKVWLNSSSSLRYPTAFTGNERLVELTGEAYFEVVHNNKMPFKVKVANRVVEDLGTSFNINAYSDEPDMKVSLLDGKLSIHTGSNGSGTVLVPGQQGQVAHTGTVNVISDALAVGASIAWKEGFFDFNGGTNLAGVLRQISRWYNIDVEYDGKVPEMQFGGKITRDCNLSEVLKILSYSDVNFKMENKKLMITQ